MQSTEREDKGARQLLLSLWFVQLGLCVIVVVALPLARYTPVD